MAKKSAVNKPTKAEIEQAKLREQYSKTRSNLLQNIRRMKSRGYDIDAIDVPEIPTDKITKTDINKLTSLNNRRYKLSTKLELVRHKDLTGEYREDLEAISGTKARKLEEKRQKEKAALHSKAYNKMSAEQKAEYKEIKKIAKEAEGEKAREYKEIAKEYIRLASDKDEEYGETWEYKNGEIVSLSSEWLIRYTEENEAIPEYTGNKVGFYNPKTGEFEVREYGEGKPVDEHFKRVFSKSDAGQLAYEKAIQDLNLMESYIGNPKHGKNKKHDNIVRENASGIKEFLEGLHAQYPTAVEEAILWTMSEVDYHSPDFMYRAGGYQAYKFFFKSILRNLGENVDFEEDEDYDEGNFGY